MVDREIKSVVIGGASGTLGKALVRHFCRQQVKTVAVCRSNDGIKSIEAMLEQEKFNELCFPVQADLTDRDQVLALVKRSVDKLNEVDAVVNASGAFIWKQICDCDEQDFIRSFDSNLKTSWNLLRNFLPIMKEQKFGRMVFVSSKSTQNQAASGLGLYLAAKAGLNLLVQTAAEEVKMLNININAVLPSIIDNEQNRLDMPDADFNTWVKPGKLAEFIESLCGPVSNELNGALIPVSGRL